MKKKYRIAAAVACIVLGSVTTRAGAGELSQSTPQTPVQAEQKKSAPPEGDAPLTREQILKQGPEALEKNCTGCHLADKWEGTNRDREGWAAIVKEMASQMDDAKMPRMSDKTFNLIVDYLTLTRPQ